MNTYNVIAALEDNWIVYWYCIVSRIVSGLMFLSFGPVWRDYAGIDFVAAFVLGWAMWMA